MKSYYTSKSKAERRQWWEGLTTEEQERYIWAKQVEKAQKRQFGCPTHGNAWCCCGRSYLGPEADNHLNSITGRDYTKGIIKEKP